MMMSLPLYPAPKFEVERGNGHRGATQSEDQARGLPPRWNDVRGRLEIGVADRRLDALIEEDRVRASSACLA